MGRANPMGSSEVESSRLYPHTSAPDKRCWGLVVQYVSLAVPLQRDPIRLRSIPASVFLEKNGSDNPGASAGIEPF